MSRPFSPILLLAILSIVSNISLAQDEKAKSADEQYVPGPDSREQSGVPKGEEDVGQTFGVWGIPQGPYLFIPIFGPTTFRDGSGWIIRGFTTPIGYIPDVPLRNTLWGIGAVDLRAQALQAESIVGQAALDPYTFIRRAYLQRRRYLVYDGQPPPAKEDDE